MAKLYYPSCRKVCLSKLATPVKIKAVLSKNINPLERVFRGLLEVCASHKLGTSSVALSF